MRSPRTCRLLAAASLLALAGCSGGPSGGSGPSSVAVRLGFFPNVTQATALVGVKRGIFAQTLAPDTLATQTFNAGPAAVEAILGDSIDAAYIGPNPAISAYTESGGAAIRVISGATSGGALLVVRPAITSAAQLRGRKLADPQLGGTQDVALRWWLRQQGYSTDTQGGGDVSILPQDNAQTLQAFQSGAVDGAWVPEPWAARLVRDGGGHVLVDERDLWPGGRFATAVLVVRTDFLQAHPDTVRRLLTAQVKANDYIAQHPLEAQGVANGEIADVTGKQLSPAIVAAAWRNLAFTDDPLAASLRTAADHALALGLTKSARLDGIFDLGPLNAVLRATGEPEVFATAEAGAGPSPSASPR